MTPALTIIAIIGGSLGIIWSILRFTGLVVRVVLAWKAEAAKLSGQIADLSEKLERYTGDMRSEMWDMIAAEGKERRAELRAHKAECRNALNALEIL